MAEADFAQLALVLGLLLGCGLVSGLMAGMLGVGGGLVLVPALLLLFDWLPLTDWPIHVAVATSLGNIIMTGFRSGLSHYRRENVSLQAVVHLTPGICLGAVMGGTVASGLETAELTLFFAVVVFLLAFSMMRKPLEWRADLPGQPLLSVFGGGIGLISSLIGIGGGSLVVPFLNGCGMPMLRAVGSSAVIGVFIGVFGSVGFVWSGLGQTGLPPYSLGYIWLPGVILTGVTSVATAPLGVRIASRLSAVRLRLVFGFFLVAVSLKLGHSAFQVL